MPGFGPGSSLVLIADSATRGSADVPGELRPVDASMAVLPMFGSTVSVECRAPADRSVAALRDAQYTRAHFTHECNLAFDSMLVVYAAGPRDR